MSSGKVGCVRSLGSTISGERSQHLRIEYEDEDLRCLAEDPGFVHPRLSGELVKAYRKRIDSISAANDERDLRALKSLHLEKLRGNRDGQHSLRLNKQYRLIVRFRTEPAGRTTVVIEIVDYH